MQDEWQSALQKYRPDEVQPGSVGGWLLYFCIVSILISPLASLNAILKPVNPYWLVCYLALVVFSVSAGIATLMKTESAFNFVRLDLIARTFYGVSQIVWALHLRSLNQSSVLVGSEIGRAIGTLLVVVLWFWYFKVSTRVHETFGRNI